MAAPIVNDTELLDLFVRDMEGRSDIWKPTNYWKGYCHRIQRELSRVGLEDFRRNWDIMQGVDLGSKPKGTLKRSVPGGSYKARLLNLILKLPAFDALYERYERHIDALLASSSAIIGKQIALFCLLLEQGEYSGPLLKRIDDSCIGHPHAYQFKGKRYSSNILHQLCLLSLVYHYGGSDGYRKILEIGGGYGSLAEIVMKYREGDIGYFVAVDIPPLVYMTTQYLKAVFPGRVIDYREVRSAGRITPSDIAGKILVIPPWTLPALDVEFDLFFNSNSFQEMEYDVVDNYLDYIRGKAENIFINTLTEGHKRGEAGQLEPISYRWLCDRIAAKGYVRVESARDSIEEAAFHAVLPKHSVGFFTRKV